VSGKKRNGAGVRGNSNRVGCPSLEGRKIGKKRRSDIRGEAVTVITSSGRKVFCRTLICDKGKEGEKGFHPLSYVGMGEGGKSSVRPEGEKAFRECQEPSMERAAYFVRRRGKKK